MIYATILQKYLIMTEKAKLQQVFNSTEYHPFVHLLLLEWLTGVWLDYSQDAILECETSGEMHKTGNHMTTFYQIKQVLYPFIPTMYSKIGESFEKVQELMQKIKNSQNNYKLNPDLLAMYIKSKPIQEAFNMLGMYCEVTFSD